MGIFIEKIIRMMKVVVFLYKYYLEKYGHSLAYFYVMAWFFIIFGILCLNIIQKSFNIELPLIGSLFEKGILYGYLEGFLVSLPFYLFFYLVFPPNKIKNNLHKYTYPKYYIWYLRISFITLLVLMLFILKI